LSLQIVDFDQASAQRTAELRSLTRNFGLSLGDRACLALAEKLGCPALTSDKSWTRLQLRIPIVAIR
jgi:ribonuclease VapC